VSEIDTQEWARTELRQRIADSGLSIEKWSKTRIVRHPSSVYRYLSGGKIPDIVCEYLLGSWRFLEDTPDE
jgi:hypothetical protein